MIYSGLLQHITSLALMNEFSYKPKITKEQFFLKGFAERKCLLIMDVIHKMKQLYADLLRQSKSHASNTDMSAKKTISQAALQIRTIPSSPIIKSNSTYENNVHIKTTSGSECSPARVMPLNPPSRHMSESWTRSIVEMIAPLPLKRHHSSAVSYNPADDSLMHYQKEDFSFSSRNPLAKFDFSKRNESQLSVSSEQKIDRSSISDVAVDHTTSFSTTRDLPPDNHRTPSPSARQSLFNDSHTQESPSKTPTRQEFSRNSYHNVSTSPIKNVSFLSEIAEREVVLDAAPTQIFRLDQDINNNRLQIEMVTLFNVIKGVS